MPAEELCDADDARIQEENRVEATAKSLIAEAEETKR
jgi:hypothetical protein